MSVFHHPVDLWRCPLAEVPVIEHPPEDQFRAQRMVDLAAADRWLRGRRALRVVLAHYRTENPDEISLRYGRYGKAYVDSGPFFNLTWGVDEVIIVVDDRTEVGVDVATLVVNKDDLLALTSETQVAASVTNARARWARLEAVLKCIGTGFAEPVSAALISQLSSGLGQVHIGEHVVGWRDVAHPVGDLCVATFGQPPAVRECGEPW